MTISLPNGATIAIASGYAPAVPITSITNAKPGVASAKNTLVAGDYVEIACGWSRVNDKVVRVGAPSATAFNLDGIDSTSAVMYPFSSSAGAFRKILGWTQLSQILSSASSGGEQQFKEYQFLEDNAQKRIPTSKTAAGLTFSVADDPLQAGYILAAAAADDRLPRAVRISLPSGSVLIYNAFISLNTTPSLTVNEIMACEITLSLLAEPLRY
ncbi:phage tail protein [Glaciimonas sp. PAMC28666]|uniref:phage tail protein n=1 Tax=Glaciimonas sp. PAMC28666 TaxID=2807626 RepID=UPI001965DCA9|nr:phage tail protein [Glaciimonas sp. PAMC28666]QRX82251.1 phage tail protein [Glaciimonas sp. PAMC28666]